MFVFIENLQCNCFFRIFRSMNNPYFGWELLYKLIEDDVKNSEDLIVALVHWQLVQLGFSCLSVGDEVPY